VEASATVPERRLLPVGVVIPGYGCAGTIEAVLDGLERQTCAIEKVVVVDDASPDGLGTLLESLKGRYGFPLEVVHHERNLRLAKSYNDGLRLVGSKYAMTLHSDCVLEPAYIERLVGLLESEEGAGLAVATGQYIFPEIDRMGAVDRLYLALNLIPREPLDVPGGGWVELSFCEGKADVFRRELLEAEGGFDERFSLTSEDQDLCAKLRKKGYKIGMLSTCRFSSVFGGTQDSVAKVIRKQRTYARGQAMILLRHGRAAVQSSTKNRNSRAWFRMAQVATAGLWAAMLAAAAVLAILRASSTAWLVLAGCAAGLAAARWLSYLWICRWMKAGEAARASFLGLWADVWYAVGLVEGLWKAVVFGAT